MTSPGPEAPPLPTFINAWLRAVAGGVAAGVAAGLVRGAL
jgi:hypothetical protein